MGADKLLTTPSPWCAGETQSSKRWGSNVSQGISLQSGTCHPSLHSNSKLRKADYHLSGAVGRFARLRKPEEGALRPPVQWPQSLGEGEVGESGTPLASRHSELLQGPLLTDLAASHHRPWQSSHISTTDCERSTSGPEASRQLFLSVMKCGAWTRFQSIQTRDLS